MALRWPFLCKKLLHLPKPHVIMASAERRAIKSMHPPHKKDRRRGTALRRSFLRGFLGLLSFAASVKPLANVVRHHACHNRRYEIGDKIHYLHLPSVARVGRTTQPLYQHPPPSASRFPLLPTKRAQIPPSLAGNSPADLLS